MNGLLVYIKVPFRMEENMWTLVQYNYDWILYVEVNNRISWFLIALQGGGSQLMCDLNVLTNRHFWDKCLHHVYFTSSKWTKGYQLSIVSLGSKKEDNMHGIPCLKTNVYNNLNASPENLLSLVVLKITHFNSSFPTRGTKSLPAFVVRSSFTKLSVIFSQHPPGAPWGDCILAALCISILIAKHYRQQRIHQ